MPARWAASARATLGVVAALSSCLAPAPAAADEPERIGLFESSGFAVQVGIGLNGFTDDELAQKTGLAVAWDARFIVGTLRFAAVELGYLGSIQSIETTRTERPTMLVTNGAEVLARLHFTWGATRPYALAGFAWRLFRLIEFGATASETTSEVLEDDGVLELPVGLGVSHAIDHFLLDLRATYRSAFDEDLTRSPIEGTPAARMDSFNVELSLGWRF